MKRVKQAIFLGGLLCILPLTVWAGDFDGSKNLVCAVTVTHECLAMGGCLSGTAESIDIPQFVEIDFENKSIRSLAGVEPVRNTTIARSARADGKLVLQGMQRGRAWSLVLNEASGKIVLTATDDQFGFVVFGACMAP